MRLTFVLPGFITVPMGGVKVVVEHAKRLAARGHQVTLVYPLRLGSALNYYLKNFLSNRLGAPEHLYYTPQAPVNVLVVRNLSAKYLPAGDVIIACGWQVAQAVAAAPTECGRKFYFLQSLETYFRQKKQVLATYQLPLTKIALSQWIIDELQRIGVRALGPLGNAINREEFFREDERVRDYDVIFFYHHRPIKGAREGLKILKQLKHQRPQVRVVIVAPRKPLHFIPHWCELIIRPTTTELRQLYNRSKILLLTSKWEGWALPPMEALSCGCAVVAFANRGVKEYLVDRQNALLAELGQVEQLFKNLCLLLDDDNLRHQLAESGLKTVAQFNWDTLVTRLEQFLQ